MSSCAGIWAGHDRGSAGGASAAGLAPGNSVPWTTLTYLCRLRASLECDTVVPISSLQKCAALTGKYCGPNHIIPGGPVLSRLNVQERAAANGGALDADALRGVSAQFQALAGPIADFSFNLNVGAQAPPALPHVAIPPAASPSSLQTALTLCPCAALTCPM